MSVGGKRRGPAWCIGAEALGPRFLHVRIALELEGLDVCGQSSCLKTEPAGQIVMSEVSFSSWLRTARGERRGVCACSTSNSSQCFGRVLGLGATALASSRTRA